VKEALSGFRNEPQTLKLPTAPVQPLILKSEENRPQPCFDVWNGEPDRAKGMAVTIGRIRVEGKILKLFLLVHNTVRGAAGNCILNAEYALKKNLIK
jgi:aspartate-semialdehyde dehydrogenase